MSESPPAAVRPRWRSVVTTVLLVMISVMIVRDILGRRWSAGAPPASDFTRHSR
ncbi:hypothetical protein [Bradyrhizobium sp. LMTR 3]|uniref:hypothetical protein n=1 Tax=Bradyrhizobium sp. LMTR 3 TaxID=189873 RepID=UPI00159F14C7|nr:hypothetical protein [Bradyrhizobium sp. LMTR 3]